MEAKSELGQSLQPAGDGPASTPSDHLTVEAVPRSQFVADEDADGRSSSWHSQSNVLSTKSGAESRTTCSLSTPRRGGSSATVAVATPLHLRPHRLLRHVRVDACQGESLIPNWQRRSASRRSRPAVDSCKNAVANCVLDSASVPPPLRQPY